MNEQEFLEFMKDRASWFGIKAVEVGERSWQVVLTLDGNYGEQGAKDMAQFYAEETGIRNTTGTVL